MNFRPLLYIAVGFGLGIFAFEVYRSLALPRSSFFGALILAVLAVYVILSNFFKGRSMARTLFVAAFMIALVRMGLAIPNDISTGDYVLRGVVSEVSESNPRTVVLTNATLNETKLKYKVRLNIAEPDKTSDGDNETPLPEVGDRLETICYVKKDFVGYDIESLSMLSSGIGLKTRCTKYTVVSQNNLWLNQWAAMMRGALKNRISLLFKENSAMVSAFLLGDRSGLDYGELESFRKTGTAHLLSLSGFHVGVLTSCLFLILPRRKPWLRLLFTGGFLLLFCMITGFSPSLVRASVMCLCVLLADVIGERRDSLSSLSLAAIIILAVSPYSLWSAGFRLSFAATIGIVLFVEGGLFDTRSVLANRAMEGCLVTVAATAATLLLSARYFGYVDTYTIPANIIAVPIYSIAITLCFAVLVIGVPLPFIAGFLAFIPDKLLSGVNLALSWLADLPYARLPVKQPLDICGFLMIIVMFIISPYILRPIRNRMLIATPVMLMFMASVFLSFI